MLNMGFSIIACEDWNELRRPTAISTSTPLHPTPRTLLGSGWTRWESEPDYSYPITLIKSKRKTFYLTTNVIVIVIFTACSSTKVMKPVCMYTHAAAAILFTGGSVDVAVYPLDLSRIGGSSAPVSVQVQCSPFLLFRNALFSSTPEDGANKEGLNMSASIYVTNKPPLGDSLFVVDTKWKIIDVIHNCLLEHGLYERNGKCQC